MATVTGERYGSVVKILAGSVVGTELRETASRGDEVYVNLERVEYGTGKTDYPDRSVVLEYAGEHTDDGGSYVFDGYDSEHDLLWFYYSVPDSTFPLNEELTLAFHTLKHDGRKYRFTDFGELETAAGADGGSPDGSPGGGSDTRVFDG